MALDEDFLAAVLAPIEGGTPVGPNGRRGSGPVKERFTAIRDAVSAKRRQGTSLRAGAGTGDGSGTGSDSWRKIASDTEKYLETDSKDLEVACILLEAYVRDDGVEGLHDGLLLIEQLIDRFWDEGLHPADDPEEEDAEERVASRFMPLGNVSGAQTETPGTVIVPLKNADLVPGFSYSSKLEFDAVRSRAAAAQGGDNADRADAALNSAQAQFDAVVQRTPVADVRAALVLIEESRATWSRIRATIEARSQKFIADHVDEIGDPKIDYTPVGSVLSKTLEGIVEALQIAFRSALAESNDEGDVDDVALAFAATVAASGKPVASRIAASTEDRAEALAAIAAAASYFEHAEPLSLVGPALRDVHRRARMSFHDLMQELMPDNSHRESFYLHSGIKPPQN